jgi:hypothetical protein
VVVAAEAAVPLLVLVVQEAVVQVLLEALVLTVQRTLAVVQVEHRL